MRVVGEGRGCSTEDCRSSPKMAMLLLGFCVPPSAGGLSSMEDRVSQSHCD